MRQRIEGHMEGITQMSRLQYRKMISDAFAELQTWLFESILDEFLFR
jgi:hypothetical protein